VIYDIGWSVYRQMGEPPLLIAGAFTRDPRKRLKLATDMFRTFPFGSPSYQWRDVPSSDGAIAFDCVKCPVADPAMADPACVGRLTEELAIVQPKMLVVMGDDALAVINELGIPLSRSLVAAPGQLQQFTPSIDALYVPNIDDALDEESAKREFWTAFRVLGQWWADLPPY